MAATKATAAPKSGAALGRLYAQLDALRDDAMQAFNAYENDADVADIRSYVGDVESRAFRIGAALVEIESGLNQL